MKKPEFKDIIYDAKTICWGHGNNIVGPTCLATISLREPSNQEEKKMKSDYEKAKEIYDTYINKGHRFMACGKNANKKIEAKITFIHSEKQSVTWKQDNLTKDEIKDGYKPASGKWTINSMIQLIKSNEIKFI